MKVGRRGFLGFMAAAPVASTMVAKEVAEGGALTAGREAGSIRVLGDGVPSGYIQPSSEQRRAALMLPWVRDQIEALVREEHHGVYRIDPDIAIHRSVSLSAKIAFQRQRNVERRMKEIESEYAYERINKTIFAALGVKT